MPTTQEITEAFSQAEGVSSSLGDPSLRLPRVEALRILAELVTPSVHWSVLGPAADHLRKKGKLNTNVILFKKNKGQQGYSPDDLIKIGSLYNLIASKSSPDGRTSARRLREFVSQLESEGILPPN